MQNVSTNWQKIIWREWRHCIDIEYGQQLFNVVADEPAGWGAKLSLMLFNAIAGISLGVLAGTAVTFEWAILQHLAWAGGVVGLVSGVLAGRNLTWRGWLGRLESNTPTTNPGRLIISAGLLGLLGFMIFGPLFWVMMAGLFWAAGGVITWLNRGVETRDDFNPEDRRWWFWWRGRPPMFHTRAAIERACTQSATAGQIWADPLERLLETEHRPATPDTLIGALLSKNWVERFVARYRLVRLGQAAVEPLQALVYSDKTPLRHTAHWLLHNIEVAGQKVKAP